MRLEFEADLSEINDFMRIVQAQLGEMPHLAEAIEAGGEFMKASWIKSANEKLTQRTGEYQRGIVSGVRYPYRNDLLHYRIEHAKQYAIALEYGYAAFDMRKMLNTSTKVRFAKDGSRYLIIPFRHGMPNSKIAPAMPQAVYSAAKTMEASSITGKRNEGVQQGARNYGEAQIMKQHNLQRVNRNTYSWGDKLEVSGSKDQSKYNNMYRFQKNTSQGQYSHYMTFRVISERKKTGWKHPGVNAMNIAGEAFERSRPAINTMLDEAIRKDIERLSD